MSVNTITEELEVRIYNNYRQALRQLNQVAKTYGSFGSRAADRRNKARKVTVERYNVPFAEVKRIVEKHDAIKGVTHEHTPEYLRSLEADRMYAEYLKNPTPCDCGSGKPVKVRLHPFDYEILQEYNFILCCIECYERLEEDI